MTRSSFTTRNTVYFRSRHGTSLVELLVAALVIGVTLAGVSELLWVNTSWTSRIFNKAGAYFTAQKFLGLIRNDVDAAYAIDPTSTSDRLILYRTSFVNGYPTTAGSEQITYTVSPEIENSNPTGRYQILRTSLSQGSVVVAKGVSGPTSIVDSSKLLIFQYVPKRPDVSEYGIRNSADQGAGSIIVNLQILNRDIGKNTPSETNLTAVSDIGIRAELFTRNETGAI